MSSVSGGTISVHPPSSEPEVSASEKNSCTVEARSRVNAYCTGLEGVWGARTLFLKPLILISMENGITSEDTGARVLSSLVLVWNAAKD